MEVTINIAEWLAYLVVIIVAFKMGDISLWIGEKCLEWNNNKNSSHVKNDIWSNKEKH